MCNKQKRFGGKQTGAAETYFLLYSHLINPPATPSLSQRVLPTQWLKKHKIQLGRYSFFLYHKHITSGQQSENAQQGWAPCYDSYGFALPFGVL